MTSLDEIPKQHHYPLTEKSWGIVNSNLVLTLVNARRRQLRNDQSIDYSVDPHGYFFQTVLSKYQGMLANESLKLTGQDGSDIPYEEKISTYRLLIEIACMCISWIDHLEHKNPRNFEKAFIGTDVIFTLKTAEDFYPLSAEFVDRLIRERQRQYNKWNERPNNDPCDWITIITEEIGEVASDNLDQYGQLDMNRTLTKEEQRSIQKQLITEIIQVCAVCLCWIQDDSINSNSPLLFSEKTLTELLE